MRAEIEPAEARAGNRLTELTVIGLAALALAAAFMWLAGFGGALDTPESAGSSLSTGPRGTLALYRWLERAGFEVSRAEGGTAFPPDADTLFMVNPGSDFPTGQPGSVRRWVEQGRTLVLAVGQMQRDLSVGIGGRHPMLRELGIDLLPASVVTDTVAASQPVLNVPPVERVKMPASYGLQLPGGGGVVLVSSKEANGKRVPLVAMLPVGQGRVFMLSSDYPFSNLGIRDESNGALAYNLAQMGGGRKVAFDEAHHGASVGGDLVALVTRNPWGWAILYAALVAGIYILWSARRLGPPLPVPAPDRRRPTSDYVTAVAGLFRRSRKPGYAAERYLKYLKRTLTRHAELDPYLTDARFVEALSERGRHTFDTGEMSAAIMRLRRLEGVGEGRPAGENMEADTLNAIREAERVRRQALGLRDEE